MIVLGGRDFREVVPMNAAIDAVRDAFVAVVEGRADQPQRLVSADGRAVTMVARLQPSGETVVKAVTVFPENGQAGLPTIHALVLGFDGETGEPAILIEGAAVTAVRTGAASGVATDLLAVPDAHVLAMVGSGGQARDQIDAVRAVRPIDEIRIAGRNGGTRQALAVRVGAEAPGVRVTACDSIGEAVAGADVVCCATTASEPLFACSDLKEDVHVNAIGAYTPTMCEIGPDVLLQARVVAVDQVSAALAEAGDLIQAIDAGALSVDRLRELGSLVSADPQPEQGGLTVFKSVGIAAQDWAVTTLAHERVASLADVQSFDLAGA
jgi:ornithine cyclodeaminase/alanine dehydrogenase-like protein (mu-crystallin family)